MLFTEAERKCYLPHFCAEGSWPASRMMTPTSFDLFQDHGHFAMKAGPHLDNYLTAALWSPIKTDVLDSLGHPEVLIK